MFHQVNFFILLFFKTHNIVDIEKFVRLIFVKLIFVCRQWNGKKETTLEEISSVSSQNDLKFQSTVSDMCASSESKCFWLYKYIHFMTVPYRKTVHNSKQFENCLIIYQMSNYPTIHPDILL